MNDLPKDPVSDAELVASVELTRWSKILKGEPDSVLVFKAWLEKSLSTLDAYAREEGVDIGEVDPVTSIDLYA